MSETTSPPSLEVDARGRSCPVPVIELAAGIQQVEIDEVVRLLATDPAASVDVPVWCRLQRHELLARRHLDDGSWRFDVRRRH